MKKVLLTVIAAALVFGLVSCGDKESKPAESNAATTTTTASSKKNEAKKSAGVLIYNGWCLYEQRKDDEGVEKMYAVLEAEAGDVVEVYVNKDNTPEQKKAIRHLSDGTESELDFVHITYDGKEYWTRDIFVSSLDAVKPGIILKEAAVFAEPDVLQITKTKLKTGTFVALYGDTNVDFVHAKIYDGSAFGREVYIQRDNVEDDETSIELVKTLGKITKDTKQEVADEIMGLILNEFKLGTDGSKVSSSTEDYFRSFINDVLFGNRTVKISEELISEANSRY